MIKTYTLENKFLRIKTLNIGATLFEVFHKRKKINLVLNLDKISSYKNNKNYLGSTCGRFANRIKNAQFKIKNTTYKLSKNEGKNILAFNCKKKTNVAAEILYVAANVLSSQSIYSLSNFYLNLAIYLNEDFH